MTTRALMAMAMSGLCFYAAPSATAAPPVEGYHDAASGWAA
jgi:hypothetical protein